MLYVFLRTSKSGPRVSLFPMGKLSQGLATGSGYRNQLSSLKQPSPAPRLPPNRASLLLEVARCSHVPSDPHVPACGAVNNVL